MTAVGTLPISPLMDPAFHEARQKFMQQKEPYTQAKSTKFQRLLARNPYGMLACCIDWPYPKQYLTLLQPKP